MPAASWRTYPARSRYLWLATSASAGASRRVGINSWDQRCMMLREGCDKAFIVAKAGRAMRLEGGRWRRRRGRICADSDQGPRKVESARQAGSCRQPSQDLLCQLQRLAKMLLIFAELAVQFERLVGSKPGVKEHVANLDRIGQHRFVVQVLKGVFG